MPLVILTKSPIFSIKDCLRQGKSLVKSILGQKRGPSVVTESLIVGLRELGVDFLYNPPVHMIQQSDYVYVNESVDALRWAIQAKKKGGIAKLIAGPAIVNIPSEEEGVICSSQIDIYLSPSQWNIEWLMSLDVCLGRTLKLWPAGVADNGLLKNPHGRILIYNKNPDQELLDYVQAYFDDRKVEYIMITYGRYSHTDFIELLKKTKVVVFLSHSESQGLALHEVWMADIPTLVWNPGFVEYKGLRWEDKKLSAPHLIDMCGLFFKDRNDFGCRFQDLLRRYDSYTPRMYSLEYFTNKKVARKFLEIINLL